MTASGGPSLAAGRSDDGCRTTDLDAAVRHWSPGWGAVEIHARHIERVEIRDQGGAEIRDQNHPHAGELKRIG
ncbi:hypothetical protein [Nocardia sp. NPDC047038]|uniref:hypothetical protein n=1 Tax=Nocardia sp. NPDC047038 TaxID=3154338 RepID=UPI0033C5358F